MTKVMRQAYAEIDEILKYMPKSYVDKVPDKFKRLFSDCKLQNYEVKIYPDKPLEAQKFVRETVILLAILKYNFWCESDEEKKKIEQIFKENSRKARERYDISKLTNKKEMAFEKNDLESMSNQIQSEENLLLVKVEKTSWFSKLIFKIKSIFKR